MSALSLCLHKKRSHSCLCEGSPAADTGVRIAGRKRWLWRAVHDEGVGLDMPIQRRRNKKAALRLLRKLVKNTGVEPETITTDKLTSYGAALRELGLSERHRCSGLRSNNRAENSHLSIRRRERKMHKFRATVQPSGSSPSM
ncbi:MAG: DDE-type integrase/transposase/recombinase [Caulobacteraceae bacterium]